MLNTIEKSGDVGFRVIIALHQNARAMMTRDMELVRLILIEIQSRKSLSPKIVQLDGYDEAVVGRHVEMLFKEGLIEGRGHQSYLGDKDYPDIFVTDLSWAGHDFVAVLQNEGVWSSIKQKLSPAQLATLPLLIIKEVGLALLKKYTMQQFGLDDN